MTYDDLKTAFEGLAYASADLDEEFVRATASCLVAHLPGATFLDWARYSEAFDSHWELSNGGEVPAEFRPDVPFHVDQGSLREAALEQMKQDRDEALDHLMARFPAQIGLAS